MATKPKDAKPDPEVKLVKVPKTGKIKLQSRLTRGVFLGSFDGLPVNVSVPINVEDLVKVGSTVECEFSPVQEGAAVEALHRPDAPVGKGEAGK